MACQHFCQVVMAVRWVGSWCWQAPGAVLHPPAVCSLVAAGAPVSVAAEGALLEHCNPLRHPVCHQARPPAGAATGDAQVHAGFRTAHWLPSSYAMHLLHVADRSKAHQRWFGCVRNQPRGTSLCIPLLQAIKLEVADGKGC